MEAPILKPIAEDARGGSWSLYFPDLNAEIVIIYSKAGVYRGGHSHSKPEVSLLLSGKCHYWKIPTDGKEIEFDETPGSVLKNAAGEIHLSRFDAPSWLADFKIDTEVGECATTNYEPYRSKVILGSSGP